MKRAWSVVLAAAVLLSMTGPASAIGGVEAGVKGGVNFASTAWDPNTAEPGDYRTGLALGGYVGIPVMPSVKIQPEALFMMKGDEGSEGGVDGTYKLNYIEVPVLAKIGFMSQAAAHPTLFVGPSIAINTTAEVDVNDATTDIKDNTNAMDFGLVVGGGVDFSKVGFDVRYTRGLTNVNDSSTDDTTINNSVISVMGTFRFL